MKIEWFVKENTWLPGMKHGWGNGYVVLPEDHPLHGKHYNDIDVDVHGGLTFGEPASELDWPEITEDKKGAWVIGFDTAHYMDTIDNWSKEEVEAEAQKLALQIQAL